MVYESPQQVEARKKLERKTAQYFWAIVFMFACILTAEVIDIGLSLISIGGTTEVTLEPITDSEVEGIE
jgi:hypothetical protein